MPDVHKGKGATIGTVFASSNYVCPNAVGVDIGCGMCAVPVHDLKSSQLNQRCKTSIFNKIKKSIPLAFESHKKALPESSEYIDKITAEHKPSTYLK